MSETAIRLKTAQRHVQAFERKCGRSALHLAYHAALPVALNTEFLHLLRINFFLDPPESLPYTAESDLLLSPLCREIGNDLYEIDPTVRGVLLQGLVEVYGQARLHRVAALLWHYSERHAPWSEQVRLELAQQLTALNVLAPFRARQWLEEAVTSVGQGGAENRDWFVAMHEKLALEQRGIATRAEIGLPPLQSDGVTLDAQAIGERLLQPVAPEEDNPAMHPMIHSLWFLQAFHAHVDRLQTLLGTQWPGFSARVQMILETLIQAGSDAQVMLLVDAIIEAGLESPARDLVRALLQQLQTISDRFDRGLQSIRMTDPTSGHTREVTVGHTDTALSEATDQVGSRAEVIAAARDFIQALQAHNVLSIQESTAGIQFTAYYPKEVRPETWYTLLAYAHLPEALAAVQADSRTRLGPQAGNAGQGRCQATQTIARGAEIVVVPELPGCRFNPPRASFLWLEDWHRTEFRVQATPDLPDFALGQAVNGRVAFYVGPVLVAEVPIWTHVRAEADVSTADLPDTQVTTAPYQRIFLSYSHQDALVVQQIERAYTVLGMQSLRDVHVLRSSEEWHPALLRHIEQADIFQLYWSNNAKRYKSVEHEWRHALTLTRPSFIRPLYWEQPMPDPPPELAAIHFAYFPLDPQARS